MFSSLQAGSIPKGRGPYLVSCADYMWGSGIKGGLVRLFYPAEPSDDDQPTPSEQHQKPTWLPDKEYVVGMMKYAKLPAWLLGNVFYWLVGNIRLDTLWNASLHNTEDKLPCVVFSHGLAGNRCLYSSFCMELASYGYLVAAVEHRDKSASATYYMKESASERNRRKEWIPFHKLEETEDEFQLRSCQVHQRAKECMQTLNLLEQLNNGQPPKNLFGAEFDTLACKDRLDLGKVSVVGHSFGGVTAVATLAKDKRFKCGVALDAWMFPLGDELYHHTVNQPLLFVNTETFHWKKNIKQINELMKNDTVERIMVTIKGTSHMTQCDLPFVIPAVAMKFIGMNSEQDAGEIIDINKTAIATFLSKYFGLGKEFSDEKMLTEGNEHVLIGSNVQV